jgi:hypothetical protein
MHSKFSGLRTAVRKKLAERPPRVFPTLWWENSEGEKWFSPDLREPYTEPPEGFILQVSQFPNTLRTNWLKIVQPDEVEKCPHEDKFVQPTYGWIDGIEGRECKKCNGTQIRNVGEPWPKKWKASGSREYMSGEASWPVDLALAMARPSDSELNKAVERYGAPGRILDLKDAIIAAGSSCERCLNALCHRYGLDDGYPRGSEEWDKSGTSCHLCDPPKMLDWLMGEDLALKVPSSSHVLEM